MFEQVPNNAFPPGLTNAYFNEIEVCNNNFSTELSIITSLLQRIALELKNTSLTTVTILLETFQLDFLTHAQPVAGFNTPSAWPPTREFVTFPNGVWTIHTDPADDIVINNAVQASAHRLRIKAAEFGVSHVALNETDVALYPNYANWNNTPEAIYGSALTTLRTLQTKYDPEGIMKLSGGFKL